MPMLLILKSMGVTPLVKTKKKKERSARKQLSKQKTTGPKKENVPSMKPPAKDTNVAREFTPLSIERDITWTISEDDETSVSIWSSASPQSSQSTAASTVQDDRKALKENLIEAGLYTGSVDESTTPTDREYIAAIASSRAIMKHKERIYKHQLGIKDYIISTHKKINQEIRAQYDQKMEELRTRHSIEMYDLEMELAEAEADRNDRTDELRHASCVLIQTQEELYKKQLLSSYSSLSSSWCGLASPKIVMRAASVPRFGLSADC